tara:strand:- start:12915 stop:13211 length:297 start_codon:yes stop_codon:yes gene_type:complete
MKELQKLREEVEKWEDLLVEKIENKELAECEGCGDIFEYVPRKQFCIACKKKKRFLRQRDYAKRDYVVAKRKTPDAISKKQAYDAARRPKQEVEQNED